MIIFVFIPWFSPAYKAGGPVQSISNLIDEFKENIHYKVFCSNADLDGTISAVKPDTWVRYNDHCDVWYASKAKQQVSVLKQQIKNTAPDVLFINGIYSWYFNMVPLLFGNGFRKIISVRGMLHPGALSQKKFKKRFYLSLWKILKLDRKCEFHASTEEEKSFIQQMFGKTASVFVAANFPKVLEKQTPPKKEPHQLKLATVALISPMKNHLLILEALRSSKDSISYNIYGPVKDPDYWQECVNQIKELPQNVTVDYRGDIQPAKVASALADSHVFILPSKSENFGHAFFEALSAGKPVITSHNTPWQNLQSFKAGINVDPEDASALQTAIHFFAAMDELEINEWSAGAKIYSQSALNTESIKAQYNNMFLKRY